MRKLGIALATLWAALAFVPAHAVTNLPTTFNVNINLTSACVITTAAGTVTFAYTAGQTTNATATSTTVGVTCTNTLPYSVSISSAGPGYSVLDATTGLSYKLTLATPTIQAQSADLTGATGQTGNGAQQTITIGGIMSSGQYGTCATATCSSTTTQTLTITY